jgi:uncharacterized protein (UPF0332 family)
MAQSSMVDRLLAAAQELLDRKSHSAAFRRRAVSTAYYAVFHALAKSCAGALLPHARRGTEEYMRIYRALDHGPLRTAFTQAPSKDHPRLKKIGPIIIRLQNERHRADYLPPDSKLFPESEVQELIEQAQFVVNELADLDDASCQLLAICLWFRDRKP